MCVRVYVYVCMCVTLCVYAVRLSENKIAVDGAKALIPSLSEMKMLQSLNLESKSQRKVV